MGSGVQQDWRVRPKSAVNALVVYYHHRKALEYDFRARFAFGVERLDREELNYSETVALVDGLLDDPTSHTFASVAGYSYVPSAEEVFFWNRLDAERSMNRGKNQPVPQRLARPWEKPKEKTPMPVSPESRARRERLNKRLGLTAE